MMRSLFVTLYDQAYRHLIRPLVFRMSAPVSHEQMLRLLKLGDAQVWLMPVISLVRRATLPKNKITVGGVDLQSPLILAAGLIKGDGFESEEAALDTAQRRNIIPGWRVLPRLIGPVEFGSFTRWPRMGNSGTVVWRDVPTRSTQNRVGLKNPGARAAAAFLGARKKALPYQYGINISVSPGVDDPAVQAREVLEALTYFAEQGIYPSWFTLNLSCPNTQDDPNGHQTAEQAQQVCGAAADYLRAAWCKVPLWVKLGPTLADEQYCVLMKVFAEIGVQAVVVTNTLPAPTPDDATLTAGVAGGRLHQRAVEVAALLMQEKTKHGYTVDVIGCGGVEDGLTYRDFAQLGVQAMQYWTALVYRGPLVAAVIIEEARKA